MDGPERGIGMNKRQNGVEEIQTHSRRPINGRPGAIQIVWALAGQWMTQGWRDRGGRVCGVEGSVLDYFVLPLPLPLPLSLPLPSVRGESGGLASVGVSLPFRLPLPLPLPFPLPFPLPLGGAPIGWGKSVS